MKMIRKLIKSHIKDLVREREIINRQLCVIPKDSFMYARLNFIFEFTGLKIAILRVIVNE